MRKTSYFLMLIGVFITVISVNGSVQADEASLTNANAPLTIALNSGMETNSTNTSRSAGNENFAGVRMGLELSTADEDLGEYHEEGDEYLEETLDPYENFNRSMFQFNDFLFEKVMKPVGITYNNLTDEDSRGIVKSFFENIAMPVRLVSSAIQGNQEKMGRTLVRFFINSTLGLGGMVDVAKSEFKIEPVEEDFDQALGYHKVGTGSYIVWPLIGPCTTRATFGKIVDSVLDPSWLLGPNFAADFGIGAGRKINETALSLHYKEEIDEMAIDPYLSVRDLYLQHRRGKLKE